MTEHFAELLRGQVLALTAEALLQIIDRDEVRVVNVEVMEGEDQILLSDGLSAVHCHSEELRVVDLPIVIEVDPLEELIDFFLTHVEFGEGSLDFAHLERARVVDV